MKLVGGVRGRRHGRLPRWLGSAALAALCLGAAPGVRAEGAAEGSAEGATKPKKVAVGFSNLVARLDNDQIGFAKAEYRVHILEALRAAGFNAVGAENLVFGKDEGERADLVLGGTVLELGCRQIKRDLRCRVGIEWQLLDRERDEVVYRVLTRYAGFNLPTENDAALAKSLTLGALKSLMKRARFQQLLDQVSLAAPDDADYTPATFASCDAQPRELPADFEAIADGTVIIKSAGGTGSGFTLSADGLVLTAAHVVSSGKVEVHTRGGQKLPGRVVRISRKQDVALVSVAPSDKPRACLAFDASPQAPGNDIYAIGSPGGEQLGFSLSRGIVSGLRTIGDVPLIQTDASLSPGNSGGPLVDRQGRVVGVVSRKIAGHAVEGLGFAIPVQAGLTALKLEPATTTTPSLNSAPIQVAKTAPKAATRDEPDPKVSLDPEGDRRRAQEADRLKRLQDQKDRTPGYVPALRWGGLTVAIVGSLAAAVTASAEKSTMTRSEYESLRLQNDLSWAATLLGAGAFVSSYVLTPKLAPPNEASRPRWSVAAGPGDVRLNVSFQ